ncbi:putative ABC transport system ATP-binding protein [Cryobacterium mesophilum]|uniref:ABC transporter ATP-binding protein n=1 Tax=Terrimesophilobacter mesophilus TaxID=433647 RepID=A0A4R8VA50_9MICO|nr:ABC transporter ATP-binding protein [Terrimesophilobacter mesophilus]MBB5632842.1 putative ABC transport system ATP-binding protein [Terrimesophilobacter mesophilus]TFB79623.1 ABC transporter ATP-binding protein [Terrimesophilobacter mesophilus]
MMEDLRPALRAENVSRTFTTGAGDVNACTDISIQVHAGELLVVRGKSGSGKTTLLNILGGLDRPTSGGVWIGDQDLTALNDNKLAEVRRGRIGYVFQTFGLIPVLSAAENIEVPLRIRGTDPAERETMVAEMLDLVGLADHAAQRPYELSGGQQQRVGLARALVGEPDILLADEPTGQLDSRTAATMMDLIEELVKAKGIAAVVSTHDPLLVARAHNVVDLHDGRLVEQETRRGRHASDTE